MTNINYELIDTTAPAPEQEPERQRYFIAKCREIIKERELEIGRKLTFYDQTFGCQMNFKDSEKLNGILEDIGYVKADTEKADFVYYNTCTVRENANVRVYGRLGALKNYKEESRDGYCHVWLYDAGAGGTGKGKDNIQVCRCGFWNSQYF